MTTETLSLAYGTMFGKAVPHWKMRDLTWEQFCRLLTKPASSKSGALSYVAGLISPGPGVKCKCELFLHRTKKTVTSRWAVTLDADYCGNAGSGMLRTLKELGVAAAAHTTWSSTEDDERYRVIVPLSRNVSGLEYAPIARWLMRLLGEGMFDDTCQQASRLMYLPSAPDDGERYWLGIMSGDRLDADLILDLAGGSDVEAVREVPEIGVVAAGELTVKQNNQLRGLCTKMAGMGEGNRDSYLLWALKCAIDNGMDPEIAGEKLAEAAIWSGLEEDVVWEKVGRILG